MTIPNTAGRDSAVGWFVLALIAVATQFDGDTSVVQRITFAIVAVVQAVLGVRSWRSRIDVTDVGLTSYRDARPQRLRWAEIDRFEYRGPWRGLGAWLRDGTWVKLQIYGRSRAEAEQVVDRLDAELRARRPPDVGHA